MRKVLSRLAKKGRSSSQAAAEPPDRGSGQKTPAAVTEDQTARPAAYDLVGRERSLSGLQRAVWGGDVARVRSLTAKSPAGLQARDREGRSLLHLAAARGCREMVELLLERHLPADTADSDGSTPLIKAVEVDSAATVRLLLERGANASHLNNRQENGLHVSARRGSEPVLQALLQHGANLDQVDQDGHTPLHLAVIHGHPEQAAALLLHGAALAPADRAGRTALHLAAGRGLSDLVAQLLEDGADPELRDDEGLTAGELAAREGFPGVQSKIRRLSRRHRSLSQMFSVEELQLDASATETTVQRLGSISSAGVPTPRVASSLSSAGVPTPRLASSLSSTREPRLASSLSSAGEPAPGPSRPDSAPADSAAADSDSWSDDDELNFAPPPRKPSIPLPACFLTEKSPLPAGRLLDASGDDPPSGQPEYSDISGLKRFSSVSSGGGGGRGDSPALGRGRHRTSGSDSDSGSPRHPRPRSRPRSRSGSGADRRRSQPDGVDTTGDSWSERSTSPIKGSVARPTGKQTEQNGSWGDVSAIPFVSAVKGDAGETGAGDGPLPTRPAAAPPAGAGATASQDSWGDDSPVQSRTPAGLPQQEEQEPEVERADTASEDSWGDSGGSPVLPGSRTEPAPARRASSHSFGDVSPIRSARSGAGSVERAADGPPARRRSEEEPAEAQQPEEVEEEEDVSSWGDVSPIRSARSGAGSVERAADGPPARRRSEEEPAETPQPEEVEEEEEDVSSWGDVSPVLPRSPADLRRESRVDAEQSGANLPSAQVTERGPAGSTESSRPAPGAAGPPSPTSSGPGVQLDEEDHWGDVSAALPRSPPGPVTPSPRKQPAPAARAAAESAEETDSWGDEVSGSPQKPKPGVVEQPAAEDGSWGDVSPILPRQSVPAALVRQSAADDSWGDQDPLPSQPGEAAAGTGASRTDAQPSDTDARTSGTDAGMSDKTMDQADRRPLTSEQASEDDSWGDESLPGMGQSDSEGILDKRQTIHRPQDGINVIYSRKQSNEESVSANNSAVDKVKDEDSWSDHSSITNDKGTCKSGAGQDFTQVRNPEQLGLSGKTTLPKLAVRLPSDFQGNKGHKDILGRDGMSHVEDNTDPGVTELGETTLTGTSHGHSHMSDTGGDSKKSVRSQSSISPPRRLSGNLTGTTPPLSASSVESVESASAAVSERQPLPRTRGNSSCAEEGPVAVPGAASGAQGSEDSGSWDDSSSAADDGGESARLATPPPADPEPLDGPKLLDTPEPSNRPDPLDGPKDRSEEAEGPKDRSEEAEGPKDGPEQADGPKDGPRDAPEQTEGPDADSWDSSSAAEPVASPRQDPAAPDGSAVTSPVRPARRRSVTVLSPARSRETSVSETADRSQTQCSASLAGTLGREGTLQGSGELWARNATLCSEVPTRDASPRPAEPPKPEPELSPPPQSPLPEPSSATRRPPRLGRRRVSISLPLSADPEPAGPPPPTSGDRQRRGSVASVTSVTSVTSTSSVSSLGSVGRALRGWRQTLMAPLRSRRRRRSLDLPVRRHSISIDSFLSEQVALTADDEVEDMYQEDAVPPAVRRASSSSPEPAPVRPPRVRLRSRSVDAPPPVAPRRPRLSGRSLADIVEADAEEEAEDRRRRGRARATGGSRGGGGGGRPARRLSLDVTALGLTRSRHRSVVTPTPDDEHTDRDSEDASDDHQADDDIFTPTSNESAQHSSRHDLDAVTQLQNMVKELREELAAERELRDSHQRRADSLQEDLLEVRTARESLLSQLSETATNAETLQQTVGQQRQQLAELQEAAAADRQHQAAAERGRLELQQLTREAEARIVQVRAEVDSRLAATRQETEDECRARLEEQLTEARDEAEQRVTAARAEMEQQWTEKVEAAEVENRRDEVADVEAKLTSAREEVAEEWRSKVESQVAEARAEAEKNVAAAKQEVEDSWKSKLDAAVREARTDEDARVDAATKDVENECQNKLETAVAEARASEEEKLAALKELEKETTLRTNSRLTELRAAEETRLVAARAELEAEWQERVEAQVADALAQAEAKSATARNELEAEWRQKSERQLAEARSEAEASAAALRQQVEELQQRAACETSDFEVRLTVLREETEAQCRQQWEDRLTEAEEKSAQAHTQLEEERQNNAHRLEAEVERRATEVRHEMEEMHQKKLKGQETEAEGRIAVLRKEIEDLQKKRDGHVAETQTTEDVQSPTREELAAELRKELEVTLRAEVVAELEAVHQRQLTAARAAAEAEKAALRTELETQHQRRTESRIAEVRAEVDAKISATLQKAEGTLSRLRDNLESEYAQKGAAEAARVGAAADARVAAETRRLEEQHRRQLSAERDRWQAEAGQAQEAQAQAEAELRREAEARLAEAEQAAAAMIAQLQQQLEAARSERSGRAPSDGTPAVPAAASETQKEQVYKEGTPREMKADVEADSHMQEEVARRTTEYEHQVSEIRADLLRVKAVFEEEKRATDEEKQRHLHRSEAALAAERQRAEQLQQQQLTAFTAELAAASAARTAAEAELTELRAQLTRWHTDRRPQLHEKLPVFSCERCRETELHHHCHPAFHGEPHQNTLAVHGGTCVADARRSGGSCPNCSGAKSCRHPPLDASCGSAAQMGRDDGVIAAVAGPTQSVCDVGVQVGAEAAPASEPAATARKDPRDGRRAADGPRHSTGRRRWDSGGGSDLTENGLPAQQRATWEIRGQQERLASRRHSRRRTEMRRGDFSDDRSSLSPVEPAVRTADRTERSRELTQLRTELGESRAHVAELQSSLSEAARQAAERQDQMEVRVSQLTRQLTRLQVSRQLAAHGPADGGGGHSRRASARSGPGTAPDPHQTATEDEELDDGAMVTSTPRRVQSEARLPRYQPAALEEEAEFTTPAPAPRRTQSEEVKVHRSAPGDGRRRGGGDGGGPRRAHCSRQVFLETSEPAVFPDWRLAHASDAEAPPTDHSELTSCSEPPPPEPAQGQARRLQALERAHAEATLRLSQEQERSARLERKTAELRARCRDARRRQEPAPQPSGLDSALLGQLRRLQETVGQEQERRGLLELELERLSAGSDATSSRVSRQLERLLTEMRPRVSHGPQPTQTDLRRMIETEFEGEARRREDLAEDLSDTRRVLMEQMVRLGASVSARDKKEETFLQQCEQVQLLSAPSSRRSVASPRDRHMAPSSDRPMTLSSDRHVTPRIGETLETQRTVPLLPELREPVALPDFRALASSVASVRPAPAAAIGGLERQPSAELSRRIRHELDQSVRRHLADDQDGRRWGSGGGSVSSVTSRSPSTAHASDEDAVDRSRRDYLATVVNIYSL